MTKHVYFHICCINDWEEIVGRILHALRDSGLYDEVGEIRCTVLGEKELECREVLRDPKIRIIYQSEDLSVGEAQILNLLIEDSQKEEFHVLYLHAKGVSRQGNPNVSDWVGYMLYFNVHLYRFALQALEHNDSCGVNYQDDHYSGNFWWSKSEYIKDLSALSLSGERHPLAAEMWLTCGGLRENTRRSACKPVSLWTSGVNHYRDPYPESSYVGCAGRYDVRFKRLLPRFDHIVVNNYECGLSSSGLLPTQPVLGIFETDKVILFYRNIFLRTIGTFIKGCVRDARLDRPEGSLMCALESVLDEAESKYLREKLESRDFPEAFRVYVGALRHVYARRCETLPQVRMLEDYGIEKIDYPVELEHNLSFFRITNCRFPFDADSKANRAIKESLMLDVRRNAPLQDAIRCVYSDDIEFFGRHDLLVDEF